MKDNQELSVRFEIIEIGLIIKYYYYKSLKNILRSIIEQIQKTAQKILRFVLHPRTKRIQNFKSVVLWRTHLCRISNLLIYS